MQRPHRHAAQPRHATFHAVEQVAVAHQQADQADKIIAVPMAVAIGFAAAHAAMAGDCAVERRVLHPQPQGSAGCCALLARFDVARFDVAQFDVAHFDAAHCVVDQQPPALQMPQLVKQAPTQQTFGQRQGLRGLGHAGIVERQAFGVGGGSHQSSPG
ncbi:hypothetical protein D3C71_1172420 [compost metagenome]